MTDPTRLIYLAGTLVLISAGIHLALGLAGVYDAAVGVGSAALPILFIVIALAAYALVGAYAFGKLAPARAYAVGAVLMVFALLAYVDVHALGVAESLTGIELHEYRHTGHDTHGHEHTGHDSHNHDHEESTLRVFIDHLRHDVYALVSKAVEAVAAVILTLLYVKERTNR